MLIEKWQALGNDYLIVERERLSYPLTAARVRLLCDRHLGLGADGVLELAQPAQAGFVAALTIWNPDGSVAELSGNGAREAVLYLRASRWTERNEFSITTAAGEVRATITGDDRCSLAMGRARLSSRDFPGGPRDGRVRLLAAGREWQVQHLQVGNPQAAIRVAGPDELDALDLATLGPEIECHESFPNRTNVSFWHQLGAGRIRARIFERGVGETSASGTGASGAAIASVLAGGESPVTVVLDGGELEVAVDDSLLYTLTGDAECVYRAEPSAALLRRLQALS